MLAPHSTLLSGIFFNSTEQFRDVVNSREVRRAVLSQAPMILAPMRRFFFAGEQQDLRHSSRSHPRFDRPGSRGLAARCSIRPNSPPCRLKGAPWVAPLFRFSDSHRGSEQTSCSESVSGIGAAKKSHHFVQSCNIKCRHRASVFQPFPHGRGRIEQLELDAVVASPLLQIHEHA